MKGKQFEAFVGAVGRIAEGSPPRQVRVREVGGVVVVSAFYEGDGASEVVTTTIGPRGGTKVAAS